MNLDIVEKVERFTLGPDDTLLVTVPDNTTAEQLASIHATFRRMLPDDARVVIKSDLIDVAVIDASEAPS